MVFSSLTFLFAFLPLFFLTYYLVGKLAGIRGKNIVLFIFSLIFYSWGEPLYIVFMIYSSIIDYSCGLLIQDGAQKGNDLQRKIFLMVSLIGNLSLLGVFKYLGLFASTANNLLGLGMTVPEIALPIGISFYTFQTMSYSIDVYRGKVTATRDIVAFGAYVTMFPQLIAGPVVRYETVAAELENRTETLEDFAAGARRFLVGLSKKVLIANIMAQTCDALFAEEASSLGALGAWVAIIAYTFQIFFDFSGYSDMAIGMGRMMGFHYLENFNYPYIATSITDFWRRWHISMSTFFRDYVYISLGGNRVSFPRWILNIAIVWFLTGLWHGASWNFVLWGLYFGLILVLEKLFIKKHLDRHPILSHVWSLLLIIYGWVIFTQESMTELWEFTKALFGGYGAIGVDSISAYTLLQRADANTIFIIALVAAVLCSMPIFPALRKKIYDIDAKSSLNLADAAGLAYDFILLGLFLLCTVQLAQGSYNPFIYFRF